ncbi:undecaprenyl-diphosphatase UppP [Rubrobacter taiwanensis]|jgi:undecaprenyl-diphosphatase|uniref:Undecaprenyl-diphosphatase n=1 Tax=Rubrobacter taiwanensis TaxID=185139 RepID=A0A4R1BRU7_9ACTN|nr:undecaprenyl-diphosphatase UppP [Rubrobacter taiwanensis]TCJ19945.1 undecaprenyl-diphosphatase UppP [Rubrobacter taiwanensis]
MRELLEAVILGVVQGTTEFLPISSSGHLLLGQYFFGMDQEKYGLTFDVALHLGSLLAVIAYFRRDLAEIARAFLRSIPHPNFGDSDQRVAYLLIVATLPAAAVGFLFRGFFEGLRSPWAVIAGLTVFGVLFILSERVGGKRKQAAKMSFRDALIIGVGQAIALLPGVSRSGSTITFGLFLGLDRQEAARFSFLMSIPITAGACLVQIPQAYSENLTPWLGFLFFAGFAVSGAVAYLTIAFLLAFFRRYSMRAFAYYSFAVSALVAVLLLLGF